MELLSDPIISVKHTIENSDINLIFNRCMEWMKANRVKKIESQKPVYIKGFHENLNVKSGYESIIDWPKIIEVKLAQIGDDVNIIINLDPSTKSIIDNYENRKVIWPKLVGDILLFCGANKKSMDMEYLRPQHYLVNMKYRYYGLFIFLVVFSLYIIMSFIQKEIRFSLLISLLGLNIILGTYYYRNYRNKLI